MPNIRHSYPGKQFGSKAIRPQESEEEESSDDEEEEEQQQQPIQQVAYRGSGKQFGGGAGKYLRRPNQDESEEEEESDEEEEEPAAPKPAPPPTQRIQPRGGGKNFMRMQAPAPEESEESDDDEEVAPPPPPAPVRVMGRGGGKSLARMQPPSEEEEESSSSEEDEAPVVNRQPPAQQQQIRPVQQVRRGGGKQLSTMRAAPPPQPTTVPPPAPKPVETPKPATAATIVRSPGGGKQLSRPVVAPKPAPKAQPPAAASSVKVVRSPGGGKTLRRQKEEDESSEEDFDDEDEEDSDEDSDEDFVEEKSKPKKAAARPKRKAATKKKIVVESDEEDDDEKYFDNEESSDDEDDKALDINNTEALIKDEDDRKHLDSLTEIEREAILAERFEKVKEKQDMQKAMREAKRKENEKSAPEKKRKAPASSAKQKKLKTANDAKLAKSMAGRRSSSRTRDVSGAKSKKAAALAALKRERKIQQDYEEKSSEESDMEFDDDDDSDEEYEDSKPWQQTTKQTATETAKDDGSDMDIDDDVDGSGHKQQRSAGPTVAVAELDDFMKVTIPRRRLKRWCNEPYFSAAVLECFVRLYIGDDDNGIKAYRLCEIVDVKEKQNSYKFPVEENNKDAKVVSTNKVLRLRFGKSEKDFPMSFLSDNPILEGEVKKYIAAQRDMRGEHLTKRRATKLHRLQNNLISNYKYTTEDIERNLEERKKRGQAVGNLGSNQTRIALAVKAAQNRVAEAEDRLADSKRALMEFVGPKSGEDELEAAVKENKKEVDQISKELQELREDEKALTAVIDDRKKKLKGMTKEKKWAKVNHKALKMNQQADLLGYKAQQEAEARKAAGVKEKFNPYARRKVKPKILWEVGQDHKEDEPEATVATIEVEANNENSTESVVPVTLTHDPIAALAESHQFQIDEEGLASVSLAELGLGPNKKPKPARVRKGLSIDEYFQRKENGTL